MQFIFGLVARRCPRVYERTAQQPPLVSKSQWKEDQIQKILGPIIRQKSGL